MKITVPRVWKYCNYYHLYGFISKRTIIEIDINLLWNYKQKQLSLSLSAQSYASHTVTESIQQVKYATVEKVKRKKQYYTKTHSC